MRKEVESIAELIDNLQDPHPSEVVVGLPYHVAETLINEGSAPPDPAGFRVLANNFEVDFRRKVLNQEPPRSVSENPIWLEKWNAQGTFILEASEDRQSQPPYSE